MHEEKISNNLLVAIVANKQSGKSTLSKVLQETFKFQVVSFATPVRKLYEILVETWLKSLQENRSNIGKHNDVTFEEFSVAISVAEQLQGVLGKKELKRGLFQGIGDGFRHVTYDDVWIALAFEQIAKSDTHVVIDDCRYVNEILAVKEAGGHIIYIDKPNSDGSHPSEQCIKNIDVLEKDHRLKPDLTIQFSLGEESAIKSITSYIQSCLKTQTKSP